MNQMTLDTVGVLDGCLKYIHRTTTETGEVSSPRFRSFENLDTMNLKGVWNSLYGGASAHTEALAILEDKETVQGMGALLFVTEHEAAIAPAIEEYLFDKGYAGGPSRLIASKLTEDRNLFALKNSLEDEVGVDDLMDVPLDDEFRRVLDWYLLDGCRFREVNFRPLPGEGEILDELEELYGMLESSHTAVHEDMLSRIREIDERVRVNDAPTTKSIHNHLDRISTRLWVSTGEVVPSARLTVARRVMRVATSILNANMYGESLKLYRDVIVNVASVCDQSYVDIGLMSSLIPAMDYCGSLLEDIIEMRGDFKIMFMLSDISVDQLVEARNEIRAFRNALNAGSVILTGNGKVEYREVNSFGGTSVPKTVGTSTVATPSAPKGKPLVDDLFAEGDSGPLVNDIF